MKESSSEKILYLVTIFLILATFFLSLVFSPKKGIFVFFFVFLFIYWQRGRLQDFFQKIKETKTSSAVYLMIGWFWTIFLELCLGLSPFHPKPIANYLIGLGFYIPYFAVWLIFIKRYQFTIFEIFYLSGLGRLIFDILITHKLLIAASVATSVVGAFLIFFIQTVVTLVLFGALTTLPALYLTNQENKNHNKPLKQYLIGLTPGFLAAGVFVIWTIILKIIFKT